MQFYHRTSKYSGWYFAIIQKAKYQQRSKKNGYFENHHIQPKCFGGLNNKENLVLLTAREHIICHRLLVRMYFENTPEWCSMVFAFKRMLDCSPTHGRHKNTVITSRQFEERRKLFARAMRIKMTGKTHTPESRKKISAAKSGKPLNAQHKASIASSLKATLSTAEQKQKISEERKTRVHSEQRKSRVAQSMVRVWAERNTALGPRPDVLPGRNTPEEKEALRRHLLSVRQKGQAARYIMTEEHRKVIAENMRIIWAKRKGLLIVPKVHEHREAEAHDI